VLQCVRCNACVAVYVLQCVCCSVCVAVHWSSTVRWTLAESCVAVYVMQCVCNSVCVAVYALQYVCCNALIWHCAMDSC